MHPILARGRRLGLFLLLFVPAGALLAEALARTSDSARWQAIVVVAPLVVVHAFTCLASWYLCRRRPLDTTALEPLVLSHLVAGVLGAAVAVSVGSGWAAWLERWPTFADSRALLAAGRVQVFIFALTLYALVAAAHYLVIAQAEQRRAERRTFQLRLEAREAELRALRTQVDPHFLFNSLNSISALVSAAPQRARIMCRQLADLWRSMLELGGRDLIALEDEVSLVERYLEIEQVRFGDRLAFETTIDAACRDWPVPALLLQPLVENAVVHGIAHCLEGGTVRLAITCRDGRLMIRIENPCDPDRPRRPRAGIGLANVEQRLETRYGILATLDTTEDDRRFVVSLTLPDLETGDHTVAARSTS